MKLTLVAMAALLLGPLGTVNAQPTPEPNPMLSDKQRKMTTISAYAAKGDLERLKAELHAGLDAQMTVNEIKEVLVHLYAYCGFPRSIRGLQTFMTVVDERRASGKKDEVGREATPITDTRSRYDRGKEIQMKVTGRTEEQLRAGYAAFSPQMEALLKEHLFADLFERDLLSFQDREIVTIAALISMGGVEPMVQAHFSAGLTVGLTPDQLKQIVSEFETMPGQNDTASARSILSQVLKSRAE
ncbi:carboxymuconolactone decarboxylase family protein [Verrucomicrobium sp. BvORR106]|uniref:carboxymuconolactone decarboxylase family protein n=1 Tax=Verrucomicrobium sp. BvORR106 TaxID=1403819 RepID=UPI00056DD764|nr:carboxymuconolactone decarboxylase family protein [Verrucomicrobium sp. BvORR106]